MSPAVSMNPSACCMMTWKIRQNQQLNCDYRYPLIIIIIIIIITIVINIVIVIVIIITI